MRAMRLRFAFVFGCVLSAAAAAQDVAIYTDTLLNGFQDFSYGGGTSFANAAPTHAGVASIAFTGNNSFNAVSFAHPSGTFASGSYAGLRFFVNGGAASAQHLSLLLQTNSAVNSAPVLAAPVPLDGYITGGSVPSNAWAQVDVPFSALAFTNDGSFDRIDIQTASGAQPVVYIDDVSLTASGAAPLPDVIFGDSFEPELLFVPQYNAAGIKIFQRVLNPVAGTPDFSLLRSVTLPQVAAQTIAPNALAFAPDGNLWVVDSGPVKRLLRYSQTSLLNAPSPTPDVVIGPVGAGAGDIFDLAFFGSNAYVSQSDFGATNRILKYALANLNASGNPAATTLGNNSTLSTPAGLAFDVQGRLWISNNGNNTLVRMNTTTGAVDKTATQVGVGATRNSLNNVEGLAFDLYGSVWAGNNGEPTLSAYADWQVSDAAFGATAPVFQIDVAPGTFQQGGLGFVGGVAFDRRGRLWANYEFDGSVLEYLATAQARGAGQPGYANYTATAAPALPNATTNPGFGGLAFWPVPPALHVH